MGLKVGFKNHDFMINNNEKFLYFKNLFFNKYKNNNFNYF